MNQHLTIAAAIIGLSLYAISVAAQCSTTTCSTPVPAFDAPSACILSSEHDLDCYFGSTYNSTPISLPPFWCTSVENNQWFAFVASATNVSFEISTENCDAGGAIQAALLQTLDCVNFYFVSDCFGNITSGSTQSLSNNVPLVPGNVYYLMIDGSAGAMCNFSINGASTITSGPQSVCIPGGPFYYTAVYEAMWTIEPAGMGIFLGTPTGNNVTVEWVVPGVAQICAQSLNCPNVPIYCTTVSVDEYIVDEDTHFLCSGDTVVCRGQIYTVPGTYQIQVASPSGCDSMINCIIISIPPIANNLGQVMLPCDGSFEVCGQYTTSLGVHQLVCQSWQGCDSLVQFNLVAGDVQAVAGSDTILSCPSGMVILDGSASSQGSNFTYSWTTTNGSFVDGLDTPTPSVDAPGTYCLTVTNLSTGCVMTDCANVISGDLSYSFDDTFCTNDSYLFNGQVLTSPGIYTVNLTSTTGCDSIVTVNLNVLPNTTEIIIATICDGQSYSFNGQTLTIAGNFSDTIPSINGCDTIMNLILMVNPNSPITYDSLEVLQGYVYHGTTILVDTVLEKHLLNEFGCDSTVIATFTVLPNEIQNMLAQTRFEVFPNPTSGDFAVRFAIKRKGNISLKILDVVGRTMLPSWTNARFEAGEHLLKISPVDWPSGVYFVQFQTDDGMLVEKLVVN